jgi:hypothetical protein
VGRRRSGSDIDDIDSAPFRLGNHKDCWTERKVAAAVASPVANAAAAELLPKVASLDKVLFR